MKLKYTAFLLTGLLLGTLYASSSVSAIAVSDRSIGISPLRREVDIAAGTSYTNTLTIKNSGKNPLTISLNAEVFNVSNQAYDYIFDADSATAKWVRFSPNSFVVQPGERQNIDYVVSVPIGSEPGGRYLSLFAASNPVQDSNGIDVVERVASLLYVTVPGNITRTGAVLTLRSPLVVFSTGNWSVTVKNSGSTHFRSAYSVTIRSLFGDAIGSHEQSNLILPSSVRLISGDIPQLYWIGIYKLDYSIGLGDTPAHHETRWIVYAPPFQLLFVGLGIGGLGLILFAWRKQRHAHKR